MPENSTSSLRSILGSILAAPTADDLWRLQGELLAFGGSAAGKAREVTGEFHSFLRDMESKVASRSASRWGAVLATAAVSSVGLQEMIAEREDPLKRLMAVGLTGLLEVAGAVKNVEAWEVEASLVYYDAGWYLYGELWEISETARPELSSGERKVLVDRLMEPAMKLEVEGVVKLALLVRLFLVVLVARMLPVLEAGA